MAAVEEGKMNQNTNNRGYSRSVGTEPPKLTITLYVKGELDQKIEN